MRPHALRVLPDSSSPPRGVATSPPSQPLTLQWAEGPLLRSVVTRMRSASRQTMNLRTGTAPRLLVCTSGDTPVAWGGLDDETYKDVPELFSLFVDPAYRGFRLGLLMEAMRWRYLAERGVTTAYFRMELATNEKLMRFRLATGNVRAAPREDMPVDWLNRCHGCELYQHECTQQTFMATDIPKALAAGEQKLGRLYPDRVPCQFVMRAEVVQVAAGDGLTASNKPNYQPEWL